MQTLTMKDDTAGAYLSETDNVNLTQAMGSQLRMARLEMGGSVDAFARALGLSLNHLGNIEKGLVRATADQLCDAARHCNKPISYFFSDPELVAKLYRLQR